MNGTDRGLAAIAAAIVAADWMTKAWITSRVALGETLSIVDGWIYLAHHRNPGVAFSTFADLPEDFRTPVLGLLAVIGVCVLAWLAWSTSSRWVRAGSALAIAGALANLGDRLINGGVTDFIRLTPFPFVFNIADTAITAGAILLVVHMAVEDRPADSPVRA